jgi:hypothetical protein
VALGNSQQRTPVRTGTLPAVRDDAAWEANGERGISGVTSGMHPLFITGTKHMAAPSFLKRGIEIEAGRVSSTFLPTLAIGNLLISVRDSLQPAGSALQAN